MGLGLRLLVCFFFLGGGFRAGGLGFGLGGVPDGYGPLFWRLGSGLRFAGFQDKGKLSTEHLWPSVTVGRMA